MTSDEAEILQILQSDDTEAQSISAKALTLQQWIKLAYAVRSKAIQTTIPSFIVFARIQRVVRDGGIVNAEQFLNIVKDYYLDELT